MLGANGDVEADDEGDDTTGDPVLDCERDDHRDDQNDDHGVEDLPHQDIGDGHLLAVAEGVRSMGFQQLAGVVV